MNTHKLLEKALHLDFLNADEGLFLYEHAPLAELIFVANELRKKHHPHGKVTWVIDRNVNTTNVCISGCKFCNFYCSKNSDKAYITSLDEYRKKIDELFLLGGRQLLLQGGMHPELDLNYYTSLFSTLKKEYPELKLHALGPPEIVYLSRMEKTDYKTILQTLVAAGLDSLPGAGAEILSDRVRKILSPNKCSAGEWLDVMKEAHKLNLVTSATMMFGHIETKAEKIEHLLYIRNVQKIKPEGSPSFLSFILWPFQDEGTVLKKQHNISNKVTPADYIRLIAISRIMLPNIPNIQASWLTVGFETAQFCLHAGANDLGSVMMEENVVSAAGADYKTTPEDIQQIIVQAGFEPQLRNQKFEFIGRDFESKQIQ